MNLTRMFGLFVCWPLKGNCPGVYHMRGDVVVARAEFKCVVNWRGEGQRRDAKKNKQRLCRNELHRLSRLIWRAAILQICVPTVVVLSSFGQGRWVCLLPTGAIILMNERRWNARDWDDTKATLTRLIRIWKWFKTKPCTPKTRHCIQKENNHFLFIYLFFQIGRKLKRGEILWVW